MFSRHLKHSSGIKNLPDCVSCTSLGVYAKRVFSIFFVPSWRHNHFELKYEFSKLLTPQLIPFPAIVEQHESYRALMELLYLYSIHILNSFCYLSQAFLKRTVFFQYFLLIDQSKLSWSSPDIFSVGSNIQHGSVSGLERDAHNDLNRLPTPQKHDDIFARPYVAQFLTNSSTAWAAPLWFSYRVKNTWISKVTFLPSLLPSSRGKKYYLNKKEELHYKFHLKLNSFLQFHFYWDIHSIALTLILSMQDYQKFAYSPLNNLLPSPPPQQLWHMINYAWKEKNMLK